VNNSNFGPGHAECENVVWMLATKPTPLRIIRAIGILCPICSQKMKDFLAIEEESMKAADLRRDCEARLLHQDDPTQRSEDSKLA